MNPIHSALRIALETGGTDSPEVPKVHAPKTRATGPHHEGPINSSVAGRTDHLPIEVASGSYVIPADIVSGMGEGNTIAGFKHMRRMFGGVPYGGSSEMPYGQGKTPYGMAKGGAASGVPIVAAGGEHVLTPDQVRDVGAGDLDRGHRVLDKWVLRMRAEFIKTLKNLKPPKKD